MTRGLEIVRGARAGEERLLARLYEHRNALVRDPTRLGVPVRVVVPSGALRRHLLARIAGELGATAGIEVRTLHATALEVLALARLGGAAPTPPPGPLGELVFELLARREAAREERLGEALEGLEAGYRAAVETVRDLHDAGFEPAHAEALAERLPRSGATAARAHALLAVARRTGVQLEQRSTEIPAALFAQGRRLLERGAHGLSLSEVLIHGFADVTGRAGDFLEALFRRFPATVFLEEPPDPADPSKPDLGRVFTERMRQRFEGQAEEVVTVGSQAPPVLAFVRAPAPDAEARAVAERVQRALDEGVPPERIAVCARDLTPHKSVLRSQFERLGIPFTSPGTCGLLDGPARKILALLELLRRRGRTSAQRWLDATGRVLFERNVAAGQAPEGSPVPTAKKLVPRRPSADLRLALRAAGGGRIADVAGLEISALLDEHESFPLPVRSGLRAGTDQNAQKSSRRIAGTHAARRRFPGTDLARVIQDAGALVRLFDEWPERAGIQRHLERFAELRHEHLRWRTDDAQEARIAPALEELELAFTRETLAREELLWLLERTLLPLARPPLSRAGESGVQLLGAMSARAHTFERLFVIGLQRELFPRVVGEDPLLPDSLRAAWSELLADIPIKARGRDEERYLFAQLLGAAPHVTLSWQTNDAEGKARSISPLLERMELEKRTVEEALPLVPTRPLEIGAFCDTAPRPLDEHAVIAGLVAGPGGLAERLEPALAEAFHEGDPPPPSSGCSHGDGLARAAAARVKVLQAFEARDPKKLLPFLGWLGPQDRSPLRPDPIEEPLFVTRIEDAVDCTWRLALSRILRIEEAPDPLERLPGIEPRILGSLVHEVLERIARASWGASEPPEDLQEALACDPVITRWPGARALERLTGEIAQELLAREGIHEPGLCRLICHVALPYIRRGQAILTEETERYAGEDAKSGCIGVELLGEATAVLPDGETLRVRFKADRVDRIGDRLILSDFKTGRTALGEAEFKRKLVQGKNLQPSAYVHGVESEGKVRARLLYLHPEVDEDRQAAILKKESSSADDWRNALAPVRDAWREGTFFPRLTDPTGERSHDPCRFCPVSSACLLGDSSARARLVELAQGEREGPDLRAFGALWDVPLARPAGGKREARS